MYGYIYLTTNLINNKKYVGQHRSEIFEPNKYLGSGKLLQKAIDKYGKENFRCELLEECSSDSELNEKEVYWISKLNSVQDDNYYNLCKGGLGHTCEPWNKGKRGVQEVTSKMLESLEYGRHLPASDNLKEKLRQIRTGCEVSDKTRQKLRDAQTGKKMSNECKEKHRNLMLGSNNPNYGGITDEHKEKLRQVSKDRVHIHKDQINKNVKKDELDLYLSDDWQLGYIYHK